MQQRLLPRLGGTRRLVGLEASALPWAGINTGTAKHRGLRGGTPRGSRLAAFQIPNLVSLTGFDEDGVAGFTPRAATDR